LTADVFLELEEPRGCQNTSLRPLDAGPFRAGGRRRDGNADGSGDRVRDGDCAAEQHRQYLRGGHAHRLRQLTGFPGGGGVSNRGDYGIQIGSDRSDDVASGIILASVANNGRDNGETTYAGIRYGEASIDADGRGWFVPMFDAATGAEYNFDFSAVYFPFAEGWVVGHARNSSNTNGGIYNQIRTGTGASAVALGGSSGNRLVAPGTTSAPQSSLGNGRSDL